MIHKANCACSMCVGVWRTDNWTVTHRHGDLQVITRGDLAPIAAKALTNTLIQATAAAETWRRNQCPIDDDEKTDPCIMGITH